MARHAWSDEFVYMVLDETKDFYANLHDLKGVKHNNHREMAGDYYMVLLRTYELILKVCEMLARKWNTGSRNTMSRQTILLLSNGGIP